jgi:putative ABC transport system substrate-binding protein
MGIALHVLKASSDRDLDLAFGALDSVGGAAGLVIAPDPLFIGRSARLAELALAHRTPAIFQYREFVAAGGLASYAGSPMEGYRLIGLYPQGREPRTDHRPRRRPGEPAAPVCYSRRGDRGRRKP